VTEPKQSAAVSRIDAMFSMERGKPIGAKFQNQHVLIYGGQGVGKTTFFGSYAGAFILPFETGSVYAAARKYDGPLDSWAKFEDAYKVLVTAKNQGLFERAGVSIIVGDSLDAFYHLARKKICEQEQINDLSDLGYGRGHALCDALVMRAIDALRALAPVGMTSHAAQITKPVEGRGGVEKDVEKFVPSVRVKIAEWISGWVPLVGFAYKSAEGDFLVKFHSHHRLESKCRDRTLEKIKKPFPNDYATVAKVHDAALAEMGYQVSDIYLP
jgi:hypothetical protein